MNIRNAKEILNAANADLSSSTFNDVNMQDARFIDVNLSRSSFSDINFSGAKLSNVNLTNVAIDDCEIHGMKIRGVLVSELLARHGGTA